MPAATDLLLPAHALEPPHGGHGEVVVLKHFFEYLAQHYRDSQCRLLAGPALRRFWEQGWMVQQGLIPGLIGPGVVTNERFGFVQGHQWHEWNLVSAKMMRYYWAAWLLGLDSTAQRQARDACSRLLATLPGTHEICDRCGWTMPGAEMWNDYTCNYCYERERYPFSKLIVVRGVPLTVPNEGAAVKDECQLMRQFQNIKLVPM